MPHPLAREYYATIKSSELPKDFASLLSSHGDTRMRKVKKVLTSAIKEKAYELLVFILDKYFDPCMLASTAASDGIVNASLFETHDGRDQTTFKEL